MGITQPQVAKSSTMQWKETTIHCAGGRASSATSAQVCQGHVREPGHQVTIPPPSQMYPLAHPRPLVEVAKLLDSLGLPLALHSGNQGFSHISPLKVPLSRRSQRNCWVQNYIFLSPLPPQEENIPSKPSFKIQNRII